MNGFTDRENQLFAVLHAFNEHGLEYVVIGGYAVSAVQHRFSVDVDLVVTADGIDEFAMILEADGYEKTEDVCVDGSRFISYGRRGEPPLSVDLMVGAVQTRQTGATWGYEELVANAELTEIEGSENAVTVFVPERELLMAMKIHSARQTDARDIVALADDVDFALVSEYLHRGDPAQLRQALGRVHETITGDGFEDAFKGVFAARDMPAAQVVAVRDFLRRQMTEPG